MFEGVMFLIGALTMIGVGFICYLLQQIITTLKDGQEQQLLQYWHNRILK